MPGRGPVVGAWARATIDQFRHPAPRTSYGPMAVAVDVKVIACPSPLNVLKGTYGHSC
jgi:hypothetical protein